MSAAFDTFVLFADMRTGSNHLEESLNAIEGVRCHGEAFNPYFIGQEGQTELFGLTLREREDDPGELLARMRAGTEGLPGFRYFHDHDPRILDGILADRACAKVILTRNPLDSYISRRIAAATGQWRLTDVKDRKDARAVFVPEEFEAHLQRIQSFQLRLQRALQISGQTAFHIAYEDIGDLEVLNGLAAFLGVPGRLEKVPGRLKRQNPEPHSQKVRNFAEMQTALDGLDRFGLTRTPNLEPRRGPAVPTYVAAATAPLLFMPMKGGQTEAIEEWLAALDGAEPDALQRDFTQKSLRQWKNRSDGARAFTVLSHPVRRLHSVFRRYILDDGPGAFMEIRGALRTTYRLPIPETAPGRDWDPKTHREAFLGFLRFVKGNLAGQTSLRTDPAWSTQAATLQGMSDFLLPDIVIRDDQAALGLAQLCQQIGRARMPPAPDLTSETGDAPRLSDILDADIDAAARDAHTRDYMAFGFGALRP
ncbi:nodulation protein NodH [Roseicyclus sp. F158]|uniref:Nodulation protein NodH n=1 Tax=Tropicimonas omnivorans TaxID=3075590 RepID=A0ABU3DD19_9RHOB|nr:nodulation protein NodH [Roseicyclus sp. F158]MDT0681555.1 nodulation protein NodH [Roseicyclus sp. F158]